MGSGHFEEGFHRAKSMNLGFWGRETESVFESGLLVPRGLGQVS